MARTTAGTGEPVGAAAANTSLIRWGVVFGGVVVGLGTLILLSSLWLAIAFGSGVMEVANNLEWYIGISAVVAMFIGGLVAGWLSGIRGFGPGFFNGLSVWAISLIASLLIGVPGALGAAGAIGERLTLGALDQQALLAQGDAFWASFISLLIGALTAGIGGIIGGAFTHPAYGLYGETIERRRAMPVGASDRGYDLSDERAYDRETIPEEERRERMAEREREHERQHERMPERERSGAVPPPPHRGDGWSSTT